MAKLRIPLVGPDVVELTLARQVIYRLGGLVQRREGDSLLVFRDRTGPETYQGFYAKREPYPVESCLISLYIDEGSFSDVLAARDERDGTRVERWNWPWEELVDHNDLLNLIRLVSIPEARLEPNRFIGRGFRQQHLRGELVRVLTGLDLGNDYIELVERL